MENQRAKTPDRCCINCKYYSISNIKKIKEVRCMRGYFHYEDHSVARVAIGEGGLPSIINFREQMECEGKDFERLC